MERPHSATQTGTISFRIRGELVHVTLTIPNTTVHPVEILPAASAVTEAIVDNMQQRTTREGKTISCSAGCAACCRQMIPISAVEARQLASHVDNMPEPHRSSVRSRFQSAVEAMDAAALTEPVLNPTARAGRSLGDLALTYHALGIACPFLENEACAIYSIRPMACREYLVTSPAEHCAKPTLETVHQVPIPARVSAALVQLSGQPFVPLPLALQWASSHPDTLVPRPAIDILRALIERLSGKSIP